MATSDQKQSQETSGWSEHRLRQLVEKVEDFAIFITDLEGNIETWNIGAERIFGYTAEEAIGQFERIIFTPEDRANNIPELEMKIAREKGSAEQMNDGICAKTGHAFMQAVSKPLFMKMAI